MRPLMLVAIAFALVLICPAAAARAQATLALDGPADAQPGVEVPFTLTLELTDFSCRHDRWVIVHVAASGTAPGLGVGADKISFLVPEGVYLAEPYRGSAESWVTASGAGEGTVTATVGDDLDDCFTVGHLDAASASWNVTFRSAEPQQPPADAPPADEPPTDATNEPPANETPDASGAPPETTTPTSDRRMPPGGGYVSDFNDPPQESRSVPGLGIVGALAALAALALLRKR